MREGTTVAELCDLYIKEAEATGRVKSSTLAMDRSRIERHVKPLIGGHSVRTLASGELAKLQADIAGGRTAKARPVQGRGGRTTGGRGVAARTLGMLGTILEYGKRHGLAVTNPARGVERFPDGKQRRFLSLEEIAKLGEAMRDPGSERENTIGRAAIRFLLLTGFRRMEALASPWAWVDPNFAASALTTQRAGRRCVRSARPRSSCSIACLEKKGCPYIFHAARGEGHFVGLPQVLARLCKVAELTGVTVYVLRHSFAAVAAELGFSELTIAGLLGHKGPGITARYAHVPDRALLAAADQVSAQLVAALDGEGNEVLPLFPRMLQDADV